MHPRSRTGNQRRVNSFMRRAGQALPYLPGVPDPQVRYLRAKLILEECFETIEGLGFDIGYQHRERVGMAFSPVSQLEHLVMIDNDKPDIIAVADGCADIKVVTTGTLSAFGICDRKLQLLVDESNLAKFGPGSYRREDGKWIKPPDWVAPDIAGLLAEQREAA